MKKFNLFSKKIFAYCALGVLILLILGIVYALITQNGMLAVALIISLVFASLLFHLMVYVTKKQIAKLEKAQEESDEMIKITNIKTKNI